MRMEKIDPAELEMITGGAGDQAKGMYYCVEGYSKKYGGKVKLYASTYEDAVALCRKLEIGTECIKKV